MREIGIFTNCLNTFVLPSCNCQHVVFLHIKWHILYFFGHNLNTCKVKNSKAQPAFLFQSQILKSTFHTLHIGHLWSMLVFSRSTLFTCQIREAQLPQAVGTVLGVVEEDRESKASLIKAVSSDDP